MSLSALPVLKASTTLSRTRRPVSHAPSRPRRSRRARRVLRGASALRDTSGAPTASAPPALRARTKTSPGTRPVSCARWGGTRIPSEAIPWTRATACRVTRVPTASPAGSASTRQPQGRVPVRPAPPASSSPWRWQSPRPAASRAPWGSIRMLWALALRARPAGRILSRTSSPRHHALPATATAHPLWRPSAGAAASAILGTSLLCQGPANRVRSGPSRADWVILPASPAPLGATPKSPPPLCARPALRSPGSSRRRPAGHSAAASPAIPPRMGRAKRVQQGLSSGCSRTTRVLRARETRTCLPRARRTRASASHALRTRYLRSAAPLSPTAPATVASRGCRTVA